MKHVVVLGAGKLALECTRYLADIAAVGAGDYCVDHYVAVDSEPVYVAADECIPLVEYHPRHRARVILAVADVALRRSLIDGFLSSRGLVAENLIHPTSRVDRSGIGGAGNIVGPNCYLGVNVTLDSYNVVNDGCSIGHHSRLGSNNFIASHFNTGNSVRIGDDNFFGLGCTVAPDVVVGSGSRLQAGLSIFDNLPGGRSYVAPQRIRSVEAI